MLNDQERSSNIYSVLYNKITENHILKLIHDHIDFSFINGLFENYYCKYYGRPAKEPELMVKLLVLQYLYNSSDKRVIEDTSVQISLICTFLILTPMENYPNLAY